MHSHVTLLQAWILTKIMFNIKRSRYNFCFTILSSLRMGSYWNPEIPFTCSWDDPSPQSSSTSPSLKKKIRSLEIYFFRNSASRKPNSEVILQTFFFFQKFFPQESPEKILWLKAAMSLWLLRLACAELGVFIVTARSCWCGDTDFLRPESQISLVYTIWQSFSIPCHSRTTFFVMTSQLFLHKNDHAIMLSHVTMRWAVCTSTNDSTYTYSSDTLSQSESCCRGNTPPHGVHLIPLLENVTTPGKSAFALT